MVLVGAKTSARLARAHERGYRLAGARLSTGHVLPVHQACVAFACELELLRMGCESWTDSRARYGAYLIAKVALGS